jgi:phosphatidylethanolamine-binding protein
VLALLEALIPDKMLTRARSGPHRYLFLLYREPENLDLKKEDVGGEEFVDRRSWKPAEFAEKHGLKLVAVNWMTCVGDGWKE